MKLSVLIPVYNEEETVEKIVNMVKRINWDKEIIIIDDGSSNGTKRILEKIKRQSNSDLKIIHRRKNSGKGIAIRTGLNYVNGDMIIIQDADLEYDPTDYLKLTPPIEEGDTKVVCGSRFLAKKNSLSLHYLANYFLTFLTNILYNSKLTDMETCYKVLSRDLIKELNIESEGFEIEAEITAKLLKKGYRILEVPVEYKGRSYHRGKKITYSDGFKTILTLLKYRFLN